ncbi:MAG: cytochrome c oxidase subunit 2 [Saprospiraceae bacterium]|jgi:cytochrome c oxidase subunit 2
MNKLFRVALGLLGLGSTQFAQAAWDMNMRVGATDISRGIFDLHMAVLWVCVAIGVLVFGAMIWSMVFHRKSKGYIAAKFHEHLGVEIAWTIVPAIILVVMGYYGGVMLIKIEDSSNSDMTVKVTGHQWKWEYEYPEEGIRFFSNLAQTSRDAAGLNVGINPATVDNYLLEVDNPLVLPIGKKVRFLLTSNDVNHAWWAPDLAIKKDAIPGFINDMWATINEPGIYRGQCAELCGKDHGFMPVVVIAKTQEDYDAWVVEQTASAAAAKEAESKEWTKADLMAQGETVYNTSCAACHQAAGTGIPGVFPALVGSPLTIGDTVDQHIDVVMNGKAGTAMQAFGTQLSDADLAAVITYERNSWGNNAEGDAKHVIQPTTIKAKR